MKQNIAQVALVVKDYDEAIAFYVDKLGFTLEEDTALSETKRWVRVKPAGADSCCLLLAKAGNETQAAFAGNQIGGRVFLFLHTDDCLRDYKQYKEKGVRFIREPSVEVYGTVAVFEDLYGNLWDMIGPAENKS